MNPYDNLEEDYMLVRSQESEPQIKKRRTNLKRINLEELSDEECKDKFRFTYKEITRICNALKLDSILDFDIKVDCRLALAVLLFRYATPVKLSYCQQMLGISECNVSRISNGIADILMTKIEHGLEFDERQFSQENCERFAKAIYEKGACYDNIVGFIDGTMQQICRPKNSEEQRIMYNGWKHMHCEKFQAISTPDGITSSLCGPFVGRRNDRGMLNESDILSKINTHFEKFSAEKKYALYGDEGYSLGEHIIIPFSKPFKEGSHHKDANTSMAKVRVSVELEFGKVAQYFKTCKWKYANMIGKTKPAQMYILSTVFKNFHTCINGSATSSLFKLKPPSLEDYIEGLMRNRSDEDDIEDETESA